MDLAFRAVDADQHYYEAIDACTRHLDRDFRDRGVQVVQQGKHTLLLAGTQLFRFIPNPTFDPIIVPGCLDSMFRGQVPEGVDPRTLTQVEPLRREYQDPATRVAVARRPGPRDRAHVPDARVRRRAGAALRHPGDDGDAARASTAGSKRTGRTPTKAGCRRADALARRSRRRGGRARLPRASTARAWCTSGPRPCPTATAAGTRSATRATIPVWARLAEASVPGRVPPR